MTKAVVLLPTIQTARAPLDGDGAPGTWTKYYNGSFGSEPGLGGLGTPLISSGNGCTRPSQPWPVFSTYLNAYVLVYIALEGWFFSTSTDLVTWSAPKPFLTFSVPPFTDGQPTDENVILVTPGNPPQVIGQTGYVLYAHTPSWNSVSHELWMRTFTFSSSATDVHQTVQKSPDRFELEQNFPNPFNPVTTIRYALPHRSNVSLVVFNSLGQQVAGLVNETQEAGYHEVKFDGTDVASGVYFYKIQAGSFVETRKLLMLR